MRCAAHRRDQGSPNRLGAGLVYRLLSSDGRFRVPPGPTKPSATQSPASGGPNTKSLPAPCWPGCRQCGRPAWSR